MMNDREPSWTIDELSAAVGAALAEGYGGPPIKAAKSKFVWYIVGVTAVVTYFAIREAYESPDRP